MNTSICESAFDNVRSVFAAIPEFTAGTKSMGDMSSRCRDSIMRLDSILGAKSWISGHAMLLGASGSDRRGSSAEKIAPKNAQLPKLRNLAVDALFSKGMKHATATIFKTHTVDEFIAVSDGVACVITVRMNESFIDRCGHTHSASADVYVEFVSSRNRDARELIAIKQTRPIDLTI